MESPPCPTVAGILFLNKIGIVKNIKILKRESDGANAAKVKVLLDDGRIYTVGDCHLIPRVYLGTVEINKKDKEVEYKPVFLSVGENGYGMISLDGNAVYEELADFAVEILKKEILESSGNFLLRSDEDGKVFPFSGGHMWKNPYDLTEMECLERYWGKIEWDDQSDVLAKLYISGEEPDKGWMKLWRVR